LTGCWLPIYTLAKRNKYQPGGEMQRKRRLGRGVAVVGAGMSKFGMYKDKDSKDLFVEAFSEMLSSVDKGADPNDIDALYLGNFTNDFWVHSAHWGPVISDLIGLTPKPATRTEGACAASALAAQAPSVLVAGFGVSPIKSEITGPQCAE